MTHNIQDRKILVLVSNGVDEASMSFIQRELVKTGATVKAVGTENGLVNSWNSATGGWGLYFPIDQQIGQTLGADFDCLIVPAGARGVQKLGSNPHAERIITSFITAGKPMVFAGDAVELLAGTSLANGWKVSGPDRSEKTMVDAGAVWQGNANVTINGIMMTGSAEDMAGFVEEMLAHFAGSSDMKVAA